MTGDLLGVRVEGFNIGESVGDWVILGTGLRLIGEGSEGDGVVDGENVGGKFMDGILVGTG